jgi:hypothetical protein
VKTLLCAILVVGALPLAARGQDAASLGKPVRVSVPLWTNSDAAPSGPDTRWNAETVRGPSFQLAVGGEFARFRSSVFNSNNGGLHTSLTYFPKARLGIEGSVVAALGSSSLNGEGSRYLLYTVGPRFALRDYRLQPWVHALAGGLHVMPQTALGQNGFAAQLGGGVDLRLTPRASLRVESDYVRSQVFSTGQNNFQLGAGFVIHF